MLIRLNLLLFQNNVVLTAVFFCCVTCARQDTQLLVHKALPLNKNQYKDSITHVHWTIPLSQCRYKKAQV